MLAGNQITARFKDALRPWASALPQFSGLPSWSRTMGVLKHHGFSPVTVFDIGVGYGTFPLYRAFPDAFYHLIDPAQESLAHMQRLARRLRCQVHPVALGDHEGDGDAGGPRRHPGIDPARGSGTTPRASS